VLNLIDSTLDLNNGTVKFNYLIKGKAVCKDFLRRATGFERRMFNFIHAQVARGCSSVDDDNDLNKITRPVNSKTDAADDVIAFLDSYFATETFGIGTLLLFEVLIIIANLAFCK